MAHGGVLYSRVVVFLISKKQMLSLQQLPDFVFNISHC